MVGMPPPMVADVFHRARPGAAVLHSAVLRPRLRQLHAGRCNSADAARDLEQRGIPGLPRRAVERNPTAALRQLRLTLEPLTERRALPHGVAAVIPTLNEAATIAGTIASIPRDVVDEIIVADSSSHDGTAAIAQAADARVITMTESGYGRACAAGAAAAGAGCGIMLFLDGDGADPPDLTGILVAPIRAATVSRRHRFTRARRARTGIDELASSAGRPARWFRYVRAVRRSLHRHVRLPRHSARCSSRTRPA